MESLIKQKKNGKMEKKTFTKKIIIKNYVAKIQFELERKKIGYLG